MKRTVRIAGAILIMTMMSFLVTGCGGTKEDLQTETTAEAEETEDRETKPEETKQEETEPEETEPEESEPVKETDKKDGAAEEDRLAAPSVSGALHVEGTQLVDSEGNPVQLRGISTHGIAWFPDYINDACFKQLREEWNANVIRLAMYTAESGGYCTDGDKEALKTLVKNGVQYATAYDMYVIIDWHILSDNDPNTYKEEAKAFFAEMAQTYAGYDNVLYEICNEPNGGTSWSRIKSYAEEVIPVIREYDEDAIIIVGTPNWSQYVDQAAADPITGYDNIMYTLHFYAATHTDSLRKTMRAAVKAGLPIFVSEYGICDASGNGAIDEKQAQLWVDAMNELGISYVAWNLSNKNETSAVINSSCNKTYGFTQEDLSASGKWLYKMLTESAGLSGATLGGESAGGSSGSTNSGNGSLGGGLGGLFGGGNTGNIGGGNNNNTGNSGNDTASAGSGVSGTIHYDAELKNSWESEGKLFCQYDLTLENIAESSCTSWEIVISFNGNISLQDGWNGNYTVDGNKLKITSVSYNGSMDPGGKVIDVGFIISGDSGLKME